MAIVFLLLMAVLALAGLRGSTTNIQIVGNMQARQEAVNTAQALLETVISTGDFANNPTAVKANAQTTVDLNGDGTADVVAKTEDRAGLHPRPPDSRHENSAPPTTKTTSAWPARRSRTQESS